MKYFETIKRVLDSTLSRVCDKRGLTLDEARDLMIQHLRDMKAEWFSGEQPNISYDDPFCRLAYLYCHVAANANLFECALRSTRGVGDYIARKLREDDALRVCGFGGGPGTE